MGQKVHPIGFRLGVSKDWVSKWYAEGKDYAKYLYKDFEVREYIRKKLKNASVSKILIERPRNGAQITIFTSRPGVVIGRKGEDIEALKKEVSKILGVQTSINIEEIRRPAFRRAMKRAVGGTMRLGASGIKVSIAGRLNGAEIARTEWYREGRVPLHTLRADIDYGLAEANTTYGVIGIKVWIFKGENLNGLEIQEAPRADKKDEKKPQRRAKSQKAQAKDIESSIRAEIVD